MNGSESNNFAVIKVGGGLIRDELESLVSSLAFLVDVGLIPVVIHGAGPQLNAKLEGRGIVSEYHGGIRVTTPEILQTAKATFQEENLKLLEALENRGVRCRGFVGGVFTAEMLDFQKFGYVGEVNAVETALIRDQIAKGVVPVITCMAEATSGQLLNVNADVAAHQLAKSLKPIKIIYLSQAGGLKDNTGKLMSAIDLNQQYDQLMQQEWFTHGNRLKLKEIKTLLDALPLSSSVSITSAEQLPRELFTHKGSGTLVKRTERILSHSTLEQVDQVKLARLLESSFVGRLAPDYFQKLSASLAGLYVSEGYSATAIVTSLKDSLKELPELEASAAAAGEGLEGISYLDKFAVDPAAQGTGTAQKLWDILTAKHPALIWRSRKENPINTWYFEHSEGSYTAPGQPWTVFYYGLKDLPQAQRAIELVQAKASNLQRHPAPVASATTTGNASSKGTRSFSSWTQQSQSQQRRSFSTSSSSRARKTRVGLIGARGYTGGELIQLMAAHPQLELVSANSRALVGQTLQSVVPELAASNSSSSSSACDWKDLKFGNLQPDELHKAEADLWVLALPNGIAKPFVDALQKKGSKPQPKLIDLSADYRFDASWTYGLPEAKGNRALISQANQVANPGCYATAMQLALLPLLPYLSPACPPSAFGVSGYSGAGTNPSRKNDPLALKDNLMPYALGGHIHEREVVSQLSRVAHLQAVAGSIGDLHFVPHVAPWFRGITMTVTATLKQGSNLSEAQLRELFVAYYSNEPFVHVHAAPGEIPEVSAIAGKCGAALSVHTSPTAERPGRVVICATLDNLLKGAASQCMQNINLMLGYDETTAIPQRK